MILITGGSGQLGNEIKKYLEELEHDYVAPDSQVLDVTDYTSVLDYTQKIKPDTIFHCAAYTAVDRAEDEGFVDNIQINVMGTLNISKVAEDIGATLIYISTDYVFDGTNINGEYKENDITNPINEYGQGKLYGENIVQKVVSKYYIIRTSWVFGEFGKNFVKTMLHLAKNKNELNVVSDQIGRPTWTRTIAEFMIYLLEKNAEYGIYQISNEGKCSWYEFAENILCDVSNVAVYPIKTNQLFQKAARPKYSVMNLDKAKNLGFKIPHWKEALTCVKKNSN